MTILRRLSVFAVSVSAICLVGCGFTNTLAPVTGGASAKISGKVFGGQQPVVGSLVSVVEVGTTGYGSASTVLATTPTLADGSFSFASGSYTCPFANTPVYLLAQGGDAGGGLNTSLTLAAGLGACSGAQSQLVNINEVTTVATAFALGQFFTTTLGATDDFGANAPSTGTYSQGLVYANSYTIPTLVNIPLGTVNPSTSTITIEAAKIYSIANTLAACVNSSGATGATDPCGILFANTTPPGGTTAPTDTLQAAVQMSLYPYQNVTTLYNLASSTAPFVGLATAPNDFTIGVSYTTPTMGLGVSGIFSASGTSSNIDIDSEGRVWFPSNLSTAPGIGYFDPTSSTFNGPYQISTYPLTQPQYVAIDLNGYVWATDEAGGEAIAQAQDDPGDTSNFVAWIYTANSGATIVGGPIVINQDNTTFWELEATDGSSGPVLIYGAGDYSTTEPVSDFNYTPTGLNASYDGISTSDYLLFASTNGLSTTCDLEYQYYEGDGFSGGDQTDGTISPCVSGGIASTYFDNDVVSTATTVDQLCSADDETCFAPDVPLNQPEGIATDGLGGVWIANSGDGSISTLYGYNYQGDGNDYTESSPIEYIHNSTNGGTITTPYGLAIDGSGNVWVSNASCVTTSTTACTPTAFVLSELIGAAAPAITPLSAQLSGTEAGTEPELKRKGLARHVSPLLDKIPADRKLDHPQGLTGVRVGSKR